MSYARNLISNFAFLGIFTMQQPGITIIAWVRCQLLW